MPKPSFPGKGNSDWYEWAQAVDAAVAEVDSGRLTEEAQRAASVAAVQGAIEEGEIEIAGGGDGVATPGLALVKVGRVRTAGLAGTPDAALVESPAIYDDPESGRTFMLYVGYSQASGRDGGLAAAQHSSLMIAWSNDGGLTFGVGSVLIGGSGSGPDADGASGGKAVWDGEAWQVYYIGLATPGYEGTPSLCHASTPSMVTPTLTRHGQIIGPSGSGWRSTKVYVGSTPVQVRGTWYMFVNAADAAASERIGLATAPTAAGPWTVDDANSPVLNVGAPGAWDEKFVADPGVFFDGTLWWMSYYGANNALTTASDGWAFTSEENFPLGWKKHPANPILPVGPAGSFDSVYAHKPFIYRRGAEHRHYYTADDGTRRSIGLAVPASDLPPATIGRKLSPAAQGTYTINNSAWGELDATNMRIILPARVGQTIRVTLAGVWENQASDAFLDVVLLASGLFMSQETTAATDLAGLPGCFRAGAAASYGGFSATATHELTAADISNGTVTATVYAKVQASGQRMLLSTANTRARFEVEILGQPH